MTTARFIRLRAGAERAAQAGGAELRACRRTGRPGRPASPPSARRRRARSSSARVTGSGSSASHARACSSRAEVSGVMSRRLVRGRGPDTIGAWTPPSCPRRATSRPRWPGWWPSWPGTSARSRPRRCAWRCSAARTVATTSRSSATWPGGRSGPATGPSTRRRGPTTGCARGAPGGCCTRGTTSPPRPSSQAWPTRTGDPPRCASRSSPGTRSRAPATGPPRCSPRTCPGFACRRCGRSRWSATPSTSAALEAALDDPDPAVRRRAARALEAMGARLDR